MKILLVEDDAVSAMALRMMLTRLGHEVTVASNGLEGWHSIQSSPTPVAILDWMMPEMTGIELCKRIKEDPRLAKTCVIILTAKQTRADRVESLRAGADVFLSKPLVKEDLIARLQIAERIIELDLAVALTA